jgi:tetratricopeptide (TPR) repeat protein
MSEAAESNANEKRAQVYFKTGNDALVKKNFDYAIDMYREALKLVPENLLYRQSLRGAERHKFGNDPSRVSRLVGPRVQSIRLGVKTSRAKQKWNDVLEGCEDVFKHDPWHVASALDAAQAAESLTWNMLAKWLLESVHVQAGEDVTFLRYLAHIYELNHDFDRAIRCWERVKKAAPNDQDAIRKIKGLAADETISRAGLTDAVNKTPEGTAGPEVSRPDLDELKRTAMSPEDRMKKEIEEQPDRVGAYLNLADHYKTQNRLDEAHQVLSRGLKAVPGDEILQTQHAEIQFSRLARAIEVYTKRVQDDPDDPELKSKLDQYVLKHKEYELKEYKRRSERRPDDLNLRYQVGLRLARLERYDEAIAEFQQARNSASLKVQAMFQAGICFEAKGLPKLAERNFNEALKLAGTEDTEILNALHYRLGRVAEAQGDLKSAEDHYNEVAANDYTYEDVAERLRGLNEKP